MIKLEHMKCLLAVANCKGLPDASVQLHRTQSALSMMLKNLEEQLGGALFVGERKQQLTPLGSYVVQHARTVVNYHKQAEESIMLFARGESGLVRIASVPSVAALLLPKVLQNVYVSHPRLHIEISDIDSQEVVTRVHDREVDFGIASISESMNAHAGTQIFHSELLMTDLFACVCTQSHPLAQRNKAVDLKHIQAYPFISNGLCRQIDIDPIRQLATDARLHVRNITSLQSFIELGLGITLLPQTLAQLMPQLCFLPLCNMQVKRKLYILHSVQQGVSPACMVVRDAICRQAKAM